MASKPYHDEETLRELYHDKGLSQYEIAERFGTAQTTIGNWIRKHGIETREGVNSKELGGVLDDPEELKRLYEEEGLSSTQIAERQDANPSAVHNRLRRMGCDMRSQSQAQQRRWLFREEGGFVTNKRGYEFVRDYSGDEEKQVFVHQLVTIAEGANPHDVFSNGDFQVHHKNEVTWDNRPCNLELLTAKEHRQAHSE